MIVARRIITFLQSEKSTPIRLGVLLALAFGILIPWLGFYWDDWPLAWFTHVLGPEGFIGFAPQRPFSGILYYLSSFFLGTRPLAWHLYALLWRWISAALFWWVLRQLWPDRIRMSFLASLLFGLYPGFSQQSIALIYSLYFIYFSLFLVSLGVMLMALHSSKRPWRWTARALLFSSATMFSTEYFYGLELLRPVIILIALFDDFNRWRNRIWAVIWRWLPYGLLIAVVFGWRFSVSSEVSYDIVVFKNFAADPSGSARFYTATILNDVYEAAVLAWGQVLHIADLSGFGTRIFTLYGWTILTGAVLTFLLITDIKRWKGVEGERQSSQRNLFEPLLLAVPALFVGGLSFWITDLPLRLGYPWDRGFLPMAFGSALALAWILNLLMKVGKTPGLVTIGLTAAFVGLSIGFHYETGTIYLRAWRLQRDLFQQLYWRAPNLENGTIVLSSELKELQFYTDNSLTGQLNWIYRPDFDPASESRVMPYYWNFIGEGWGSRLPEFVPGQEFILGYRFFEFSGNTSRSIVLHYDPRYCLRVLEPNNDLVFPKLPEVLQTPLTVSSPEDVIVAVGAGRWPAAQFGAEAAHEWCYAYQKAELARQVEDWDQIKTIGDEALEKYEFLHPAELIPFIISYAYLGEDAKAERLSLQAYAYQGDERMQPLLCRVWREIGLETGADAAKKLLVQFECPPEINLDPKRRSLAPGSF